MPNTEFNATNGEQNSVQALTSDNVAQENAVQSEPQKPFKLSEFLQSSDGKGLSQNDKGQFVPDNKQIKILVNCVDESTGELISLAKIDTSKVTSMKELFRKSERKDFSGIEKWDTSGVSTFASMFESVECFNSDISGWNVENAKSFYFMFWNASSFNQPIGEKWHTKSAEGMIGMFCQARSFNNGGQPFGEKWVMDKVKWTWRMFWGAENFNQEINHWNVANVENMQRMFMNAKAFNKPLHKWNVSNVKNMEEMFNGAESFNQDLSAWGDKLGNAQTTKRMFAATKALTIDFLGAWKIPENCNTENIIKGSALESKTNKGKQTQLVNFIISELKGEKIYTKFSQNAEFLGSWLPQNIKAQFKVYLARYDENDKLVSADINSWEFAFCELFDYCFLIEKVGEDGGGLNENVIKKEREFSIYQGRKIKDFDEFEESKNERVYNKNELEIYFAPQNMWIINTAKYNNSESILSIVSAFVLLKAYKAKMRDLDEKAKNYKSAKDLQKSHENLCQFDLHSYQNTPIAQNELESTLLIEVWREMSKFYMVATIHDELKETIFQISQLVSNQKQDKLNVIMRWVAVLSAIAAALAAVPVVQNLLN